MMKNLKSTLVGLGVAGVFGLVGCTGGKHRSITFARKIAEYCTQLGYEPGVQHRDAKR